MKTKTITEKWERYCTTLYITRMDEIIGLEPKILHQKQQRRKPDDTKKIKTPVTKVENREIPGLDNIHNELVEW